MGVTAWLFDKTGKLRQPVRQLVELVHSEADGILTAEIPAWYKPRAGESLGFLCVDGRYRMFAIDTVDELDERGTAEISARDAAWAELSQTVCENAEIKNRSAESALAAVLSGTGWEIGTKAEGSVGEIADAFFEPIEEAMTRIAETAKVELRPYYEFDGSRITARKIDMLSQEPVYRGRIISAKTASNIILTEEGTPMTRVYPVGGYVGQGDSRERLTIEGITWSTAAGDPADKPSGRAWLAMPGQESVEGRAYVYEDMGMTDAKELAKAAWDDLQKKSESEKSGTATAADISYLPGYDHTSVQTNDLVGLMTRSGEKLAERVANVRRDYVRPDRTVLEFGKRENRDWIQKKLQETEKRARGAGGSAAAAVAEVEDLGAELYRAVEQLVELEGSVETQLNEVYIDLDAVNARLDLAASAKTVSELGERVSGAEISLDALNAEVLMRAYASDLDTLENEVYLRMNAIDNEIELKADKITLNGYVTASQLSAEIAAINKFFAGTATATSFQATLLHVGSRLTYGQHTLSKSQRTTVDDVTLPTLSFGTINYKGSDGNNYSARVCTGYTAGRVTKTTAMNYVSWS